MKTVRMILLLVVAAMLLVSCDSNESVESETFPVGSTYDLTSFATLQGREHPIGGANIRITFRDDGAFRGRTFTSERGHNTFWGNYSTRLNGTFTATGGAMTEVNEPEGSRVNEFLDALLETTHFTYHNERLLLFYGDTKVLVLERVSDVEQF